MQFKLNLKANGGDNADTRTTIIKNTGKILEIYDKPTGRTGAIAMQHDVDYSVCGDDKKCKHRADKKWSMLLMQCLGSRDSGVIGLLEIQLMQKES